MNAKVAKVFLHSDTLPYLVDTGIRKCFKDKEVIFFNNQLLKNLNTEDLANSNQTHRLEVGICICKKQSKM